nr:MAG TPA: hypothetical protein [Caudoviricetes sp.]
MFVPLQQLLKDSLKLHIGVYVSVRVGTTYWNNSY